VKAVTKKTTTKAKDTKTTKPKTTKDTKPKTKDTTKAKKSPAKSKKKAADSEDDDNDNLESPQPKKKTKAQQPQDDRTYEEIYQKKTPLEHILLRPDSYVGPIERQDHTLWVYDEGVGMNYRNVNFVPGLYKIFDEILVNAADNYQRDNSMNHIQVNIDSEKNVISVWNNGQG
jgi:DNA topoisomerase-2